MKRLWYMLIRVGVPCLLSMSLVGTLSADIQQKDREVVELLQERVTLFSDLAEVTGACEVPLPINTRNLFRANTAQAPRAEKLLLDSIAEGTQYAHRDGDSTAPGVWARAPKPLLVQGPACSWRNCMTGSQLYSPNSRASLRLPSPLQKY